MLAWFWAVSGRIRYPPIDRGLVPSRAVNADGDLPRKRALAYLSIEGRAAKPRACQHGLQADDAVEVGHRLKLHRLGSEGIRWARIGLLAADGKALRGQIVLWETKTGPRRL